MRWKPNVTVAAIAQQQDRFLLIEEESDGLQVYNQPAGHLEENETLFDAVKREVLEETAWYFEPESLVGVYLYPSPHNDITYLRVCFFGNCTMHEPERELDEGIIRACWMSKAEIESHKERLRSPLVLRCIEDFLAGQCYPLEILKSQFPSV